MASRDLTKSFLERRSAAKMRRRTGAGDGNGSGGGAISPSEFFSCWFPFFFSIIHYDYDPRSMLYSSFFH